MKNITTKEKVVFFILWILVGSIARAAGISMAASNTFIALVLIFLVYKFVISKLDHRSGRSNESFVSQKSSQKLIPDNKHLATLGVATVVISLWGLFYWFEIRPARIRSACSWVKLHSDAVPERSAMTEQELSDKGMLADCSKYIRNEPRYYGVFEKYNEEFEAFEQRKLKILCSNEAIINEYKTAIPAQAAKDWFEKATKEEYEFCLHDRGL